jgi:hypothetical protein
VWLETPNRGAAHRPQFSSTSAMGVGPAKAASGVQAGSFVLRIFPIQPLFLFLSFHYLFRRKALSLLGFGRFSNSAPHEP